MKKRVSRKVRQVKESLEKMLEMLRPFLPTRQVMVPKTVRKWKLSEDALEIPKRTKGRNPAAI